MADVPGWWPQLTAEPLLTIDPRRAGGQPCIAGTRVTAETVAWSVWEQGVEATMHDHGVTREQALTACWWLVGQILNRPASKRSKPEQRLAATWALWWRTDSLLLASDSRGPCPEPPEAV